MKKDEYNLEAYKFIRQEIEKRLDIHYKTIILKFIVAGSIIAFLLDKGKTIPISPYAITPIFLYLMDIIILENLGHIKLAGIFIKKNIESCDNNISAIKWESDFAQSGNNWGCFSIQGYIFGIWLIAPLILIGGFFFDFDFKNKVDIYTFSIAVFLTLYSFFLILNELKFKDDSKIIKSKSPLQ